MKLDVYFDCSSPWTYLGFHNVQTLANRYAIDIDWIPILVGGVFNRVNLNVYEQRANPVPAKARYMLSDLQDWTQLAGLEIRFPPSRFPINSVKAMRACLVLKPQGLLVPFARKVFEAYWRDDQDIADSGVLRGCLEAVGADADAVLAEAETNTIKSTLRTNTETLIARGGFGSPTFFLGDKMFFGNDRLPLIEAALAEQGHVPASVST